MIVQSGAAFQAKRGTSVSTGLAREPGRTLPTAHRNRWRTPATRGILCLVSYPDETNEKSDHDERRRLARTYAEMMDGELLKLAQHPAALTDAAWEALEDELDRRHLEDVETDLPVPQNESTMRDLVLIRQFRDLPEALLAKGSLESVGIECFLADENLVRLDWFISNFIGGIKLRVHAGDAENASKLLDEPILERLYVHGVGLYDQPRCPKCQSLDVNFQELDRPIAYLSAFLRVPIPVQRKAWRCHSCDAEWPDEALRDDTAPENHT